jgi:outer membrane lipoprotein-sorting protein
VDVSPRTPLRLDTSAPTHVGGYGSRVHSANISFPGILSRNHDSSSRRRQEPSDLGYSVCRAIKDCLAPFVGRGTSSRAAAAAFAFFTGILAAAEPGSDPILAAWLNAHAQLETWSAEVRQTRSLAALAHPLVSTGHVYYSHPGIFRWELGRPPETIAIRSTNALLVVYPGLQRAERYPLNEGQGGPLRDALTLMEAGFPKDEASLRERHRISAEATADGHCHIELEPRRAAARRMVRRVALTFETNVFTLVSSEIEFADGSRLHNQFSESVSNQPLPPDLFDTNLPSGFELVEPALP